MPSQLALLTGTHHSPKPSHRSPPQPLLSAAVSTPWMGFRADMLSVLPTFLSMYKKGGDPACLTTFLGVLHARHNAVVVAPTGGAPAFAEALSVKLGDYTDPVTAVTALLSYCVKISCYKPIRDEAAVFLVSPLLPNESSNESGKFVFRTNKPEETPIWEAYTYVLPLACGISARDEFTGTIYTEKGNSRNVNITVEQSNAAAPASATIQLIITSNSTLKHLKLKEENHKVTIIVNSSSSSPKTIVLCVFQNFHRTNLDGWESYRDIKYNHTGTHVGRQEDAIRMTELLMTPLDTYTTAVSKVTHYDQSTSTSPFLHSELHHHAEPPAYVRENTFAHYQQPPRTPRELEKFFTEFRMYMPVLDDGQKGTWAPLHIDEYDYAIDATNHELELHCTIAGSSLANEVSRDAHSLDWANLCRFLEQNAENLHLLVDAGPPGSTPRTQSLYKMLGFKYFSRSRRAVAPNVFEKEVEQEPLSVSLSADGYDGLGYMVANSHMLLSRMSSTSTMRGINTHGSMELRSPSHRAAGNNEQQPDADMLHVDEPPCLNLPPTVEAAPPQNIDFEFTEPITFCFQWRDGLMSSHCFLVIYDWMNSSIIVLARTLPGTKCKLARNGYMYEVFSADENTASADYNNATKCILALLQEVHNRYKGAVDLRLSILSTPAQRAYVTRIRS